MGDGGGVRRGKGFGSGRRLGSCCLHVVVYSAVAGTIDVGSLLLFRRCHDS